MGLNRPSVSGGGGGTISGVTAGSAISGGGSSGSVSVALDISELSDGVVATADKMLLLDSDGSTQILESVDDIAKKLPALTTEAAIDVGADYMLFLDGGSTGECKKESLTDLASALAGTGLSASSGVLSITETGDISSVVAGDGLSGGGTSGDVTLTLSDLHPVGVDGSANSLVTDDGDGTVTSEANLQFDGNGLFIKKSTGGEASADISDYGQFWVKDNGAGAANTELYFTDDAGNDIQITDNGSIAGGGGGTDLNGLSAGTVNVAADSFGFIDADDSNASKKDSIADLVTAMAGTGLSASSGQLVVSASNTATALVSNNNLAGADVVTQIFASQVFS